MRTEPNKYDGKVTLETLLSRQPTRVHRHGHTRPADEHEQQQPVGGDHD